MHGIRLLRLQAKGMALYIQYMVHGRKTKVIHATNCSMVERSLPDVHVVFYTHRFYRFDRNTGPPRPIFPSTHYPPELTIRGTHMIILALPKRGRLGN
jgi:hypothetical protein